MNKQKLITRSHQTLRGKAQCLTFSMGAIALSSDAFLGVRNLAILIMHVSAVAFCVSAQILLLQWANPLSEVTRTIRWWLLLGIGLELLLTGLFFFAGGPGLHRDEFATGSSQPIVLTYLLVFIVSQAIPCVTIFRQCLPYARSTSKPWLRRALRLLAVGAVVLFLYCLARTVNIISPLLGFDIGGWQIISSILSAIGIIILSVGLTMPSWGIHVSNAVAWVRNYASYKALYPLWHSIYESSPGIALEPPNSSVSDLRYRLHRRVIEIRDGWRALRPYMDRSDSTAQTTNGGSAETRQAFIEAMKIKQAIRAKDAGHIPENSQDAGGFDDRDATTFVAEVSWLRQVSMAYRQLD
ncbi:MAG: hypothetical protein M3443_11240 [Actinomycetota bacterium]|nr:hypothetical protein [Actinomycetota bacterium]